MNTKIISVIIVISSFISWIIWSYIFLYFIKPELDNVITKVVNRDVIRDWKTINITNLQSEITKLVWEAWPWVVNIIIKKDIDLYRRDPWWFYQEKVWSVEKEIWWWSWFFITQNWTILTNKHVVSDPKAKYTVITNEWKEFDASVVALDPLTDLAVIKIDNPENQIFKVIPAVEDERNTNIWEFVVAIWNALWEFQNSISFWVISWKNRSIEASWEWFSEKLVWLLQTDAAINPWNSWWPLLNINWEVVWINTAISWEWQWLWFSIPLSKKRINYLLDSIKKYWSIKRPFIWISYIPINENIQNELWLKSNYGWYIPPDSESIIPWSNAEKSWIEKWDIILEIDWQEISIVSSIQEIIQNKIPWDTINLKILKSNWEEKNIEMVLWEY